MTIIQKVWCPDCEWHGTSDDLFWNGMADRTECPNCTGVNFKLLKDEKSDMKMVKAETFIEVDDDVDGWARCKCGWKGPILRLGAHKKTARDTCPSCQSVQITYIDKPKNDYWRDDPGHLVRPSSTSAYNPCHVTHKPLPLIDGLEINGGSCLKPKVSGCDIYIGFDGGMELTERQMPWNPGTEVLYAIPDQGIPKKPKNFRKLVEWTAEQLREGRTVHAGCIGGHGRTGMFFAALVAHMGVSDNPVKYVRDNYCHRAVESDKQINYLATEWGCKKVRPAKGRGGSVAKYKEAGKDNLIETVSSGTKTFGFK